jgi:hypothetical protein
MLSSVLNSERAIAVNNQIMCIYTKMLELLLTNKDIPLKLEQLERKVDGHERSILPWNRGLASAFGERTSGNSPFKLLKNLKSQFATSSCAGHA